VNTTSLQTLALKFAEARFWVFPRPGTGSPCAASTSGVSVTESSSNIGMNWTSWKCSSNWGWFLVCPN